MRFLNFTQLGTSLLDLFFPEKCTFCFKNNIPIRKPLCMNCLEKVKTILANDTNKNEQPRCEKCGGILQQNMCICKERKFFFERSFFVWPYHKEARRILKQAKFQDRSTSIRYLKNQIPLTLWKFLEGSENAVLLPMPSSHKFIFKMSKFLANESSLPLYTVFYKKQKKLQSKLLHQKDRFLQIEKNMLLNKKKLGKLKLPVPALQGGSAGVTRLQGSNLSLEGLRVKKYILIDDIWTSGATMNYASKLIHEEDIPQENIFVIALFRRDKIK